MKSDPVISVVRVVGVIATGGRGSTINDENLSPYLEKAFTKGTCLLYTSDAADE